MEKSSIGNGCLINPRVLIIPKTKIGDCMVVCGPNMKYHQPLTKRRNHSYIKLLTEISRETFDKLQPSNLKYYSLPRV